MSKELFQSFFLCVFSLLLACDADPVPAQNGDDSDKTTLTDMGCEASELLVFDGTQWACTSADSVGTPTSSLPWNAISDKPAGFADDTDNDTLASLSCGADMLPVHDGTAWACAPIASVDTTLSEAAVEDFITNGALDLAPGSTMDGAELATGPHTTTLDWTNVTGKPAGFADDHDGADLEVVENSDPRVGFEPSVFDCAPGNWCIDDDGWGPNRFASDGYYTYCTGAADCSANSITLALDNNTHGSVLFSYLPWSNSRFVDVEVSFDGGSTYAHHKRIDTFNPIASLPYVSTVATLISNLPQGDDIRVRLISTQGRLNFEGFALARFTVPEAPAKGRNSRAIVQNMSDVRNTSTSFTNVTGRILTIQKLNPNSMIHLRYQDTFGFNMPGGTQSTSCTWRVTIDGNAHGRTMSNHSSTATGWRIWSGSMEWLLTGLGVGSHTLQIQVQRGAGASECLNGWVGGSQENFLWAEEID